MATEYPISEEQVRFYEENGYIQLLGVLTPEELEQVRTALDEVMAMQLDGQHDLSRGRPDYERIFVQCEHDADDDVHAGDQESKGQPSGAPANLAKHHSVVDRNQRGPARPTRLGVDYPRGDD